MKGEKKKKKKRKKQFEKYDSAVVRTHKVPLISGSACLGSQLSHSSLDGCYSVFSSKFHGGRLIQYNRVHFLLICMYR